MGNTADRSFPPLPPAEANPSPRGRGVRRYFTFKATMISR